mmetsp:Transcript_6073/g.4596  ORF Transcript_6073/g.4596 Transcript_6073/m.4596 type:complete len:90 (+) Transcript_6073:206-475(+)
MSDEKAKIYYRKMIYGSTYERFFGKYTQINAGEAEILKYKKFSELKVASILNPMTQAYIESWILMKEDNKYVNLCLEALRSLFTFLKTT